MLAIVAKSKIKEGCKEQFFAAVRELQLKSQAEEGNISFSVTLSREDSSVAVFIELWKDQAAFDFHTKTEHFTTILPALDTFIEEHYPTEFFEGVL